MKTFDLFDTLATSRTGTGTGEVPVEDHIPIAENISKVSPDDVIVSDYHTPEKAQRILKEICGLDNKLIVTEDGKAAGKVWAGLNSELHLGDNFQCDYVSPTFYGITAQLTNLAQLTDLEKLYGPLGWVMREARLRTWNADPVLRGLQLHQIERNFPFLYAVAHKLDAKMREGGFERLLLCSRDCYLLTALMNLLFSKEYQIEYFWTSRLTRYRPSSEYKQYATAWLSGRTLIVDMNGSGKSLKYLTDMFGGTPLLVCGTNDTVPFLVAGGIRETSNLAPDPMVNDVSWLGNARLGYTFIPRFINPTRQEWMKPEILQMKEAFTACLAALIGETFPVPNYSLDRTLSLLNSDPATNCLWADHLADSKAAYELLNSGPLPHSVTL